MRVASNTNINDILVLDYKKKIETPDSRITVTTKGMRALHYAALYSKIDIVDYLLHIGAGT